jgi:UDP-glucose 4-epimerase
LTVVSIVGASGFIGSHLVDALLVRGYEVRAISRTLPGLLSKSSLKNTSLSFYPLDIQNYESLKRAVSGSDFVFHLACSTLPASSNLDPRSDVSVNLLGTLNLLDICVEENIKRLVVISSGGTVYGVPRFVPITEEHPTNPICSYGITKLAIEKYVSLYNKLYGLNGIILRVSNPYGERQRFDSSQGVIPIFLREALQFHPLKILGDGSSVRDYLYISDLIDSLLAVMLYDGAEYLFNIGSGNGLSLLDLVNEIQDLLGRSLELVYTNKREFDVPSNILSIAKAQSCLSWAPQVSISEGLVRLRQHL